MSKDCLLYTSDLNGYVLFHTAKDLYQGTKHISLSELVDPELVGDMTFELIITAFLIRRYGCGVLSDYFAPRDPGLSFAQTH